MVLQKNAKNLIDTEGDKCGSVEENKNEEAIDGYHQRDNGDLLVICLEE